MLKINTPVTVTLTSNNILAQRNPKAVFVRKHNLAENLTTVQNETRDITELTAKEWLFLIEGHRKYSCAENHFLDDFTGQLDITAEDPIINPFTSDIAEAANFEINFSDLNCFAEYTPACY